MWIYGLNPVFELLRAGRKIAALYIHEGRHKGLEELRGLAKAQGIAVEERGMKFFDERFPKGHQGVAAKVEESSYTSFDELLTIPGRKGEPPFFLVLDLIEDPRNLGALIRSAEAAGVHGVVIQERRAAGLSPVSVKASAGALEYMPVSAVPNIKNALREFKKEGIKIAGAEAEGVELWEAELSGPLALVLGSEGKGLRKTVREMCDQVVGLPMRGRVNSLNVSVAGGILMYEILRQRFGRPPNPPS